MDLQEKTKGINLDFRLINVVFCIFLAFACHLILVDCKNAHMTLVSVVLQRDPTASPRAHQSYERK